MSRLLFYITNSKNPFAFKSTIISTLLLLFAINSFALTNYYLKAGANPSLVASWGNAVAGDGSGTAPTNFTTANQVFNVRNNATVTLTATWTVSGAGSKVIIGDATNACNFTVPSGFVLTAPTDVSANATLTIANTTIPALGTLNAASTVVYSGTSAQAVTVVTYGNLTISNTSTATLANNTTIAGDFTLSAGVGTFRFTKNKTLTISGNFVGTSGTFDYTSANNSASTISLTGNFSNSGVLFSASGSNSDGTLTFSGTGTVGSPQTFSNTTAANMAVTNYTINAATVVQLNSTLPLDRADAALLTVTGTLNMQGFSTSAFGASGTAAVTITNNASATLMTSHALGIPGAIPSTNTTTTFNSGANYEFDGTGVTGVFTLSTALTVGSLTINSTGTVTASQAFKVTGALTVTAGTFNLGTNLLSTMGSNGAATAGTIETQNTSAAPVPTGKTWHSTVLYDNSSTPQTVMAGTYTGLTINTTVTHTTSGSFSVSGVLDITGTLNMGTTSTITAMGTTNGTGTLQTQVPTATSATPIPAGKTWTFNVTYNAAAAQTVMQGTYNGGISFSAAGVKTFTAGTNNIGGDWNSTGGKVDVTTNVVVTNFTGTGAQAITDAGSNSGAGVVYGTVNFSGAGVKTISGKTSVQTNWTSTGGNIDMTTNSVTLVFTGAAAQSISDAGSNGGAGVKFFNVQFSGGGTKTLTTGNFTVASTGTLTMAASTILAAGGNLILASDATGSATVAQIPATSSITGSVNVKRFFTGGPVATQRTYRLVSSPVNTNGIVDNSTSTAYFTMSGTTDLYTGGPGGTGSGFTIANAGTPTVFLYRENTPPLITSFNYGNYNGMGSLGATPFAVFGPSGSFTLWTGNAMLLYYVGSISSGTTFNTKVGSVYPDPDNTTAAFIGTLNQGTIPVKLWYNSSTSFTYTGATTASGFYLVGNPYPSTIDLTTFSNAASDPGTGFWGGSLMSKAFYIYDYSSKQFNSYTVGVGSSGGNATQYIASGQGFFAKATSTAGAGLKFYETAKTTASNNPTGSHLLMGAPVVADPRQFLRLKVTQDAINKNEVLIVFGPDSKDTYENDIDINYLKGLGSTISINTFAKGSGQPLVINQMHSIDSTTRVKINIGSTITGVDTLSGTGFEKLDQRYPAYLVDHYKNDLTIPFTSSTKYVFNITLSDTTSYGSTRFELVFQKNELLLNYKLLSFTATKVTGSSLKLANSGVLLNWTTQNEGNFTGFTVQRADASLQFSSLYTIQSNGSGSYSFTDNAPLAGINKYRLMQDGAFDDISYSDTITVTSGGHDTDDKENKVKVFPNPVINQLHVSIGDNPPAMVHITIMSSGGNVMISKDVSGDNIEANVSKLFPGVYLVEISDVKTKRIIGRKKFVKL